MSKRWSIEQRLSYVLLCTALIAVSVSPVAAQTANSLIAAVQHRYNSAQTLRLHFAENFEWQGHTRPTETGELTLRKQGKMRWDYTQPVGKLFISNGKTVFLYTAADNRVEKISLRDTADLRAPLAFLLGHLDLNKEFRDFSTRPGDSGSWLEAKAKDGHAPYEALTFLADGNGAVKQLKITGRDGSVTAFHFSGEVLNPPVDDKMFHFVIPQGAEIVDAIDLRGEGK